MRDSYLLDELLRTANWKQQTLPRLHQRHGRALGKNIQRLFYYLKTSDRSLKCSRIPTFSLYEPLKLVGEAIGKQLRVMPITGCY